MKNSMFAMAVLASLPGVAGTVFTTPVAERPDEPVLVAPMPADWVEHPFVESNPEPDLTPEERRIGFMTFSRAITAPVYRETRPENSERISALRGFAARGERAQFNFAVYPASDLSGFSASADTPFPATLEQITYSPFKHAHYTVVGKYRVKPAYLVPAAKTPLRKGEPLRYVLAVKVPKDAKPGRYTGRVRLGHSANASAKVIPLELTVLPFELKRDPAQYRTGYVGAKYDVAKAVEYGFSMPGTVYINYDAKGDRFYGLGIDDLEEKWKSLTGERPRRYIALANFCGTLYRLHMKKPPVKGSIEMPPDAFFGKIEKCGREFTEKWRAEGRPELFVIAADEPRVQDIKYISRLFRTFKKAGFKTFVTSWSKRDAELESRLADSIDVWCDQFFVTPKELAASGKREHWCYPNHNVFEQKVSLTMARGSRMTWGFGMWKMADTTLVPWAWSWKMDRTKLPQLALGSQVMKPDGTEWIEWIWESVFAGTMDGAYLYTLQDAVFRRGGPPEARKLLQDLYSSVPVQPKYLAANHWPDDRFGTARTLIAEMIVKTLEYPEKCKGTCPSVLPGLEWAEPAPEGMDFLAEAEKTGCIVRRDISSNPIWPCETGCKMKRLSPKSFRSTITIDHEDTNGGRYKRSSPAAVIDLVDKKNALNLNDYGFLRYEIKYTSNRSADDAAKWPHSLLFTCLSGEGKRVHSSIFPDTSPAADQWHRYIYPLSKLNFTVLERSKVQLVRWYFLERDYEHGDVLDFEIRNAELVGAKCPVIMSLSASAAIAPATSVEWKCSVFGQLPADGVTGKIVICRKDGSRVCAADVRLFRPEAKGVVTLPVAMEAGDYRLRLLFDKVNGAQCPPRECALRVADLLAR